MSDVNLAEQINALQQMSTAELAAEYERLHGRAPRYRSVPWMKKRIGYALQVAAHGGLCAPARAALDRLVAETALPTESADRDDGLRPGTLLQREWHGKQIRAFVTADGFEFEGDTYRSLSAVAKAATGAHWNGRLFFNLTERKRA